MLPTILKTASKRSLKFADETNVVGQIMNNDATEYRKEIANLVTWSQDYNVSLNVSKMKELVI